MPTIRRNDIPQKSSQHFIIPGRKLKNFNCVSCQRTFFIKDANRIKGSQIPLIRSCGHAMCDECSYNPTRSCCPHCQDVSVSLNHHLPILPINFYAVGLLLAQNSRPVDRQLLDDADFHFQKSISSLIRQTNQHCYECKIGRATCRCLECFHLYCNDCFANLHSFLTVKSHKKVLLENKEDLIEEQPIVCKVHSSNIIKHVCRECDVRCCNDCIVYEHRMHSTIEIRELNELHEKDFVDAYENVANVIGQVYNTKKEVKAALTFPNEIDNSAKIEFEINQHFLYLHGILQNLESHMIEILHTERDGRLRNLIEIQEELQFLETRLQHGILLADLAKKNSVSIIHEEVIKILKELTNVRCYLLKRQVSDMDKESIMFHVDPSFVEAIKNHCSVKIQSLPKQFSLVTANELPDDYVIQPVERKSLHIPPLSTPSPELHPSTPVDPTLENSTVSLSPCTQSLSVMQPHKGREVHVTHIVHPFCFYVRDKEDDGVFEEIERELAKYSTMKDMIPQELKQNSVYVVRDSLHDWHRVRVTRLFPFDADRQSKICEVYAIDHGFKNKRILKSKLRTMTPVLSAIPPLAKKHSLYDIHPENGNIWSPESIDEMKRIIGLATEELPILYEVNDDGKIGSDLLIPTTAHNDALSLRDTLLFLGHGRFLSTEKLLRLNPSSSNVYHHEQLELHKYYDIDCLHVESPECFYVRKCDYNENYFVNMINEMTKVYKHSKKFKSLIYNPIIGMNYAVPYDGSWHRGVVLNIPGVKTIEIFLVDLGKKVQLDYDKIRRLDPTFTRANTRAIKLSLKDVVAPDGGWQSDTLDVMTEFMKSSTKMVISEIRGDCYIVTVLNHNNTSLKNVLDSKQYNEIQGLLQLSSKKLLKNSLTKTRNKFKSKRKKNNDHQCTFTGISQSSNIKIQNNVAGKIQPKNKEDPYRCRVNVIHVISPDEIYLATTNNIETFDEIHDEMQKFYSKQRSIAPLNMSKGSTCAVRSPRNDAYYRAKIVQVNDDNIEVFFIDLGEHETVAKSAVQNLADKLHDIPAYLFKVRLAGIYPPCGQTTWTSSTNDKLKEIINNNEKYNFFIAKVGETVNEAMTVDLFVEQAKIIDAVSPTIIEINSVNRLLVEEGLALPIKNYNDTKLKVLAADIKKEINFHNEDTVEKMNDNVYDSVVTAEDNSDEFSIDPPKNMSKLFPNDAPSWLPAEPLPKNSFDAQTTYIDWDGFVYLYSLDQFTALQAIEDEIQNLYQCKNIDTDCTWNPGDMCMVKYEKEDKWCRGVVHQVLHKVVSVEYVDYGDLEWQSPSTLCKDLILEDVPRIANKCQVEGLVSNTPNGKWNSHELLQLHAAIVARRCHVTILHRIDEYNVIRFDWIDGVDGDLLSHLIRRYGINISTNNIDIDDNSSDKDSSADIYFEPEEDGESNSADVIVEGTVKDGTDTETNEVANDCENCANSCCPSDSAYELPEGNEIHIKETNNEITCQILTQYEKSSTSSKGNDTNEYKEKFYNYEDNDDHAHCINVDEDKDHFEDGDEICHAVLPAEYSIVFKDLQLPNNEGVYTELVLPDRITEFCGAIGEVDKHKSNIVWLHPSETNQCSVLNYYRTAYSKLQREMEATAEQQPLLTNFNSNTPCCVQFKGIWHRGVILSSMKLSGLIEVLYVDWGNSEWVDATQIHTMKKEWFNLPTLTIECRLWNTRVADNVKARNWLISKRDNSQEMYEIEIVARQFGQYIVKIFEKNNNKRLMYQDLIDRGIFVNNVKDYYLGNV